MSYRHHVSLLIVATLLAHCHKKSHTSPVVPELNPPSATPSLTEKNLPEWVDPREFKPQALPFGKDRLFLGEYELLIKPDQIKTFSYSHFFVTNNTAPGREIQTLYFLKDGVPYYFSSLGLPADLVDTYGPRFSQERFDRGDDHYQAIIFPKSDEHPYLFAIRELKAEHRSFFVGFEASEGEIQQKDALISKALSLYQKHKEVQLYEVNQSFHLTDHVSVTPSESLQYSYSFHEQSPEQTISVSLTSPDRKFAIWLGRIDPTRPRQDLCEANESSCRQKSIPVKEYRFDAKSYGQTNKGWQGVLHDREGRPLINISAWYIRTEGMNHSLDEFVQELSRALDDDAIVGL